MAAAATGEMEETIVGRLTEALSPVHLEVINESHMHSGPAKESHFKVPNVKQYAPKGRIAVPPPPCT